MRIGTAIFTLVLVALFVGVPIWGYQVYLKSLREQSSAVNKGTEALGNSAKADLKKIKQQYNSSPGASAGTSAGTLKNANKMIDQIKKAQKQR